MPVTVKFNGDFIESDFVGLVTDNDFARQLSELSDFETKLAKAPDRLSDLSASTKIAIDYASMAKFADRRRIAPLKNKVRLAVVVGNEVQFGLARMYQTMCDHPDITLEIFRDRAKALAWLRPATVRTGL